MTTGRMKKIGHDARIRELRALVDRDPLNVNQRFMLASSLEAEGRVADAVQELAVAVEKARRNLGVAHCNYAVALMKVHKPDEALTHFDLAIEIDPQNASFYLSNKAHALVQLGLAEKARSIYEQISRQKDATKATQRIAIRRLGELGK